MFRHYQGWVLALSGRNRERSYASRSNLAGSFVPLLGIWPLPPYRLLEIDPEAFRTVRRSLSYLVARSVAIAYAETMSSQEMRRSERLLVSRSVHVRHDEVLQIVKDAYDL